MLKKLLFLCLFMGMLSVTMAQDPMAVVPNDPDVRTGVLEGGSRYYIRSNKKDPQRANFHIVYNVGAVQEEDNQQGLAHFLEHMAFNGSKHFTKSALIDYLQSIGVRFGENLNAGTAQQLTTYMITDVPITRQGVIDSALLILHDWAGFISLNEKDIDDERNVIREEWRTRNTAEWRAIEAKLAAQFNNTKLSKRNIIGNEEVLKTFSYQDIRDFYNKWYRPDLQAFIIVGDFDAVEMEAKLKQVMANVKESKDKAPKEKLIIPDNDKPLFSFFTDPELRKNAIELTIRMKGMPQKYSNTIMAAKMDMIQTLFNMMMRERISDIVMKGNAPFLSGSVSFSNFGDLFGYPVDGYDAMNVSATSKDGQLVPAFKAILTEMYRAQRGGFSEPELERAKAKILSSIESQYKNRNDRTNHDYVGDLENAFLLNTPFPAAQTKYDGSKAILEGISLEQINASAKSWAPDKNWTIVCELVTKEGNSVPTQEVLTEAIAQVQGSEIEIIKEEVITKPLINKELKGSKITKSEKGEFGSTIWTLQNGTRVIFKPSELKADQLIMKATQKGGTSTIANLDLLKVTVAYSNAMKMMGLGDFTAQELTKVLSGKIASCSGLIGQSEQGYFASSAPKDAETMFQLLYLQMCKPRFDTTSLNVLKNQMSTSISNMLQNPGFKSLQNFANTLYGNNPRLIEIPGVTPLLSMKNVEVLTIENLKALHSLMFASATDMTFTLVGNISEDELKPLVEKYIGSLPITKITPKNGDLYISAVKGKTDKEFKVAMETPKVTVMVGYSGDWKYTPMNEIELNVLNSILEIRYTKSIREEAGGTYGVGTLMSQNALSGFFTQIILFDTDQSKKDQLLPIVYKEIDDLIAKGPTAEDLNKVKENYKKNFAESLNNNSSWLSFIMDYYMWNMNDYTEYVKNVDSMTVESIKEAAKRYYGQGNICTVVQLPAEK